MPDKEDAKMKESVKSTAIAYIRTATKTEQTVGDLYPNLREPFIYFMAYK